MAILGPGGTSGTSQMDLKEATFHITHEGRDIPIFSVGPNESKMLPGLIVIHEIFGLNDHIKDVARRFAGQSIRVFAPDLFASHKDYPPDENGREDLNTMRQIWSSIPDTQLMSDLAAVFDALSTSGPVTRKIGAIGYCMGGAIAYMFACHADLAFVCDYYGRIRYASTSDTKPKHPIDYTESLRCPVLGLFSGQDDLIPVSDIEALKESLAAHGKRFQIKIYEEAKHAFFNDQRDFYNEEAAHDAWKITQDFIKSI